MTDSLIKQFKKRRLELDLKQQDMLMRAGIYRQQYQDLESKGNTRLDTLTLVAKGLNSELLLIPKEKLFEVNTLLENKTSEFSRQSSKKPQDEKDLSDDPWQDLLEDDQ